MLTVCKACDLQARVPEESWLIEGLWGLENVGIIGGLAKAAMSWLAFEMAVAVASGRPCLGRYPASPKPVSLRLVVDGHHPPHLETIQTPEESPVQEAGSLVLSFLTRQSAPASTKFIRRELKIRKQRVIQALTHLEQGQVERGTGGWIVKTSVNPSSNESTRP
ncbi:hypothetical protein COW64_12310 [bacterium (Candidatus Blackallbacteria) CG18_big_fil_WC_8_21_14_2_50_49_26]|nr:MAG: hypothetical protein COW64_12310 [bacterium (Candidatus Blackallbacteria) CG18_big_fil_WC_8_21_14_2_50_49_26]